MIYISKKIVELRKKNNMTQAELSKKLNVTYQAVSKWETGTSSPDFKTMVTLSKIFNVSLYYFIEEENNND